MAEYTLAQAAFTRAAALASTHHAALDTATRLMTAHTWIGGGAPAFATDVATHRSALQSAFTTALHALADLVVRHGGPPPPIPLTTSHVTSFALAPSAFQGMDPAATTTLITTLDQASHCLSAAASHLSSDLSAQGLPTGPGQTIAATATWAGTQSTDLRRRLTQLRQTVPGAVPAALAAYTLFGSHTTPQGLLSRVAAGDAEALTQLQQSNDPGAAARVSAWWHSLPPATQQHLLTMPAFGLLNGLPAPTRNQANRLWLTTLKTRLTNATAQLRDPAEIGAWEKSAFQLRRLELIERELQPRPGYPAPLLLGFDVTGQGRLIISWGNPDTADITVTNVSGLTSGLDACHGDLERSRALWQQATKTSAGRSVASITWLGYDAPQVDPTLLNPAKSVAFDSAAIRGGAALATFTDGLRASHAPSSTARAVVVGHSYGSLTTGHAATLRPGRLADDLILVGSPGVGVDRAEQLGLNPRHVWVGEAGGDPVAALGRFGTDPGHDSFGAQHFPVGREVWTAAHSSYWDHGSPSLRNMGRIINGQYEEFDHPAPLSDRPQLLMPELAPDLNR